MKHLFAFLLLFVITEKLHAQCGGLTVNHWESCVLETTTWKYKVPTSSIPGWQLPSFNDAAWTSGIGGIGYGDGDDNTLVNNPTTTVYMRKTFSIIDTSVIKYAVFCMDYDDGFVAYLNGKEFARSNMPTNQQWNSLAGGEHEAQLYQGYPPEYFVILPASLDTLLINGTNVLSIETHNANAASPDLSSRPFLQLGITNSSTNYSAVPSWYTAPVPLQSNLPLVIINTLGQTIMDGTRITCDMGIIDNGIGATNCSFDPYNNYDGKITIEIRGSTSQGFPKVPYGLTTVDAAGNNLNVPLLGNPPENDWVLLNPYTDKTFMRDELIYGIARSLNWYASRAHFVELMINGQNQGVYVLLEKIKRDKNRVNVAKITPTANSGDSLTGGYICKIDKLTGNSGTPWNTSSYGIPIQNHDPDWNEITPTQQSYIKNYINNFDNALAGSSFANPNTGYRKYSNPYSFADFFILNEISNNLDGYRLSTFFHKDRNSRCGKLTMGPIWDFNLSFGNGNYCNGYQTTGWQLYQGCGLFTGSGNWVDRMLQDPWFKTILNCRWNELRQTTLSTSSLLARIDANATYLQQASVRDSAIWQTIGNYIWPNGWIAPTWHAEIDSMKLWLTNRMNWIDANIYPASQSCGATAGLSLVIDELNFNSDSTLDAGDWLELYNYGSTAINLSNAVLLNGDNYENYCELPNNTILNAGQRLVIYEDSLKFATRFPGVTNKIGPLCFKLNNGGQKLTMRDKDNKLITSFTYVDTWQGSADGFGRTLQLVSTSSNPSLEASWIAGCVGGSPGVAYTPCIENPIYSEINYNSSTAADIGDFVELYNKNSASLSLSGWTIRNSKNTTLYTFPNGYSLSPLSYVVLYSDATKFNAHFPTVFNKLGPIGFLLGDTTDVIRLYDNTGKLKYSVSYQSNTPWPNTPNGGGTTLENGLYTGNPNAATTWFAGCPKGSPGKAYTPNCTSVGVNDMPMSPAMISIYPNPVNDVLYLESSVPLTQVTIVDMVGKDVFSSETDVKQINTATLAKGMYVIKCSDGYRQYTLKFSKR